MYANQCLRLVSFFLHTNTKGKLAFCLNTKDWLPWCVSQYFPQKPWIKIIACKISRCTFTIKIGQDVILSILLGTKKPNTGKAINISILCRNSWIIFRFCFPTQSQKVTLSLLFWWYCSWIETFEILVFSSPVLSIT